VAIATALLTAFYTFRAYFRTFHGELRMPAGAHPHEPWVMSLPLIVLAIGAAAVGIVAEPFTHWFSGFLTKTPVIITASGGNQPDHHLNWPLMFGSAAAAAIGFGIAWNFYVRKPGAAERSAEAMPMLYNLSRNKMYVDEVYNLLLVQPATLFAGVCRLVESVVDDLAKLVATVPRFIADVIRWLQNGLVQFYALVMVLFVAAIIVIFVLISK
jgi:NADH-quinone oxidoreductase subunit L